MAPAADWCLAQAAPIAVFGMAYDRVVEGNDLLTEAIIGAAIEVHRHLGPGLLESTYEQCMCWELRDAGLSFVRQAMIPINYKGNSVAAVYRPDLVVEDRVMLEIKSVDRLASVHEAQLLTYMRHTGIKIGLLLNFNCPRLRDGLKRLSI
jgi:GxxExxY protein